MDILAHTLWTTAIAREGNTVLEKKQKPRIHVGWAAFWGVFPDLFAFTIPVIGAVFRLISGGVLTTGSALAPFLYQFSHSLIIWAVVFVIVWSIRKRPPLVLLGWLLHILIDIPSHALNFYPTPFLFPLSHYRFPYGVSWANQWYMIVNYSLLAIVWIGIFLKSRKTKTVY
jgi:hypothetical protein